MVAGVAQLEAASVGGLFVPSLGNIFHGHPYGFGFAGLNASFLALIDDDGRPRLATAPRMA